MSVTSMPMDIPTSTNSGQWDVREEMVTLYQNIDHLFPDTPKRTIQFCASRAGEGATVIAREFANIAVRSFDKSVLIIDANTRSLDQCVFFGVSPSVTLLDVVKNTRLPLNDALYSVKNPDITLCALVRPESTFHGVFNAKTLGDLFERLKEKFDLIVIDSAPVIGSADSVGIAASVDGVVLIMEAETTRWPVAEEARNRIQGNGGNILGVVLNKRKYYTPDFIYRLF